MRINPSIQTQPIHPTSRPQDVKGLSYQARVLKKALETHQDKESQLLKMVEPKGQVIDIRA